MDYRIQHLLVDEFQDTSASQIHLLNNSPPVWSDGDGRTLFLVGDPMQSIYRFRKAEVSLFIEAWQGHLFDHIQLIPLQLTVNFRSNRPVVDWVNRTFPLVMPLQSDPVLGAVSYSEPAPNPGYRSKARLPFRYCPSVMMKKRPGRLSSLSAHVTRMKPSRYWCVHAATPVQFWPHSTS